MFWLICCRNKLEFNENIRLRLLSAPQAKKFLNYDYFNAFSRAIFNFFLHHRGGGFPDFCPCGYDDTPMGGGEERV